MFRRKGPSELEIAKENEIKYGITQELSKALKTIQKENIGTDDQVVYSTDTANAVCSCLEAAFLHGLKANTVKKIASYIGIGQQAITEPKLNFWNFALKFTHSEVVAQLKHLGQITTEIGLCRAWVRVGLNDGLMESYVDAMVSDKKTLETYYHRTAYLRDSEQPGIMKTYLHGLMTFEFKLSYNASVLNEWSYAPLTMAGVIESLDAPPPVIKPAATSKKQKQIAHVSPNSPVDVRQVRTRSRGSSDEKDRNGKIQSSDNPMQQPKFGPPSDSSYYVTSSEFTSKDVEEFKKLVYQSSPVDQSECSSSSRVSCPDPPMLNLSPATYVQKTYGDTEWSSKTDANQDNFKEMSNALESLDDSEDILENLTDNSKTNVKKIHKLKPLEVDFPPISPTSKDLLNEIYNTDLTVNSDQTDGDTTGRDAHKGPGNNDLEESWEEFYRSPVKAVHEDEQRFKRVQRLESVNQEMTEESILNSFIDLEEDSVNETNGTGVHVDNVIGGTKEKGDFVDGVSGKNDEDRDSIMSISEIKRLIGDENPNGSQVSDSSLKELDIDIDKLIGTSDNKPEKKKEVSKILSEENIKQLTEELKRDQSLLEEKIKHIHGDKTPVHHKKKSPTKKKKDKRRSSMQKLKPELSLSPPKVTALEPELSDAFADKIDRVQLENPEYLSKHRLSLPAISGAGQDTQTGGSKRKSLPNVLEQQEENEENNLSSSPYNMEEHLKAIYDGMPIDKVERDDRLNEDEERIRQRLISDEHRHSVGNSLTLTGRGWSSSFESEMEDTVDALSPPRPSLGLSIGVPIASRPKSESFGTLLQNYTPSSSLSAPSIDDVLQHFPRRETFRSPGTQSPPNEETDILDEGFEVVMDSDNPDPNSLERLTQLADIANEKGLAAQNFQCKGCARAVGLIFGKPRVCKYDGGYYCYECHENDEYYIPAIIVHNWDFRKHKVSKKNLAFLQEIEEQAYIDVEKSNPRLYDHVPEMQDIKMLRLQLLVLKTYLFSCKQSTAEDFRRLLWPRDYLYENIDIYSLADLLQVPTGGLASSLRKVIRFATKHVYGCRLCSQKGFICELCNNPKVIYAFEMDATYKCPQCRTVFHKECKTDNRPCPKCHRRFQRESTHGIPDSLHTPEYDLIN